jgi:GNAT superfamily N-acetyltransferase
MEIHPVRNHREKESFLTFPWRLYRDDPLWVPPLLDERRKATDPARGGFFHSGQAEFFVAWESGQPVGTLCCAEERSRTQLNGHAECMIGFFECIEDYRVAEALFQQAEAWARAREMRAIYGTYQLDREDSRGILVEGRDRPPVTYCGHNPPYYAGFFERYGFAREHDDGLAYAVDLDLQAAPIRRLGRLAERVRARKDFAIRGGNFADLEAEIDRILLLQNEALKHLEGYIPYTRADIEAMVRPLLEIVDPGLILFAEADGKTVGWFPGVPNMNEVLIHLNGLRYPWDYLRLPFFMRLRPKCLTVKSVAVLPEYWDTGVAVLLFDEMTRRAAARGYTWIDLSLTGEDNPDTWDIAHHMGAQIYKRYRFYRKELV